MKRLLSNPEKSVPQTEMTPRQQLLEEVVSWVDLFHCEGVEKEDVTENISRILSKYDIYLMKSSFISEIPEYLKEGNRVTVNYHPGETEGMALTGEVVKILYRETAYDFSTIFRIILHPDTSQEQRSLLEMTAWEETKPKTYHRLVLNTQDQGILIIPLIRGVTIEQE